VSDPAARLRSLDALRGFDMFWIVGGGALLSAWAGSNDWAWLDRAAAETEHAEWHGFTAWDLVFPLFLFLAGVSTALSFAKRRARGASDGELARHALRRGLLLVLLGAVYNGLLRFDLEEQRYASVLGRIGLAWMGAALLSLRARSAAARLGWVAALLLGYWAALELGPGPGFGAGNLAPGATLTDWIDRELLPGRLHRGVRDPEGILGTLPAVATALLGVLAGEWLRREDVAPPGKVVGLALAAAACLALGATWALVLPLNKNLWTSSFVLWTAGWSLALLALFYLVIDVWKLRRWAFFFEVIGLNAIAIYLLRGFVDFDVLAALLLAGKGAAKLHPALLAGGGLALAWLVLYALHRARIFFRV
jgi:predicted acyltransferase